MSIRIVVNSTEVRTIPFVYKRGPKSGQSGSMHKQAAWAFCLTQDGKENPYPEKIEVDLREGQQPYPAGEYTLHPSSFWVGGQYGGLNCSPRLAPIKARQPATV